MPDFNPNEMDALFRDGAERHEFEYNPDAWVLMEAKLDKKAKKRRIFFYLLGLICFLVVMASYSYFNNENSKQQIEIATNTTSENIETEKEKSDINLQNNEEELKESKTSSAPIITSTQEYISSHSKESGTNIGAQYSFQSENTGNLMGHEIVSIGSHLERHENEKVEESNVEIRNKIMVESDIKVEVYPNVGREKVLIPLLGKREISLFEGKRIGLNTLDLQIAPKETFESASSTTNRWAITAFANPEWSSVGLFKESKTGWSLGTKIGYQFADKFEINAGIAYSRKIYKGGGKAYTMAGGWFSDIEPMRMDAKCDVIEIPIGLSYYANGFRNSGFFVDVGINSYMLHSEWYGFEYDDALVRPARYVDVNENSENNHLIGVGRIAFGYQKVISKNSSFQVAPYLQFPLTGIGAGQVNVYSSGVQLAVKFNTQ